MPRDRSAVAAILLALGILGLLGAPIVILSSGPDLTTRTGRHLLAGSLGIVALVFVVALVCIFALRKGETWALWAAAIPFFVLGLPIFVVDAVFVPQRTKFLTLLPQAIGNAFGLTLLGYLVWRLHRRN